MRYKMWKFYANPEKEEKWLGEMAAKGLGLISYSWGRYEFEDIDYGKYQYKIELLDRLPSNPISISYLKFLEETGVECVGSQMRWVYLRKRTDEGEFSIFSDLESKIKYYTRIIQLWRVIALLNLFAFLLNLGLVIHYFVTREAILPTNLICTLISGTMTILFFLLVARYFSKIRNLKKEKLIHE